jgi:predicted nucleic acid-binding protein
MNGRFFLDSNIFVSSFDRSSPAKVRRAVAARKGIVSYQVAQEFFNVALRRFAQPMTVAEAEQYLATVFRPLIAIHSGACDIWVGLAPGGTLVSLLLSSAGRVGSLNGFAQPRVVLYGGPLIARRALSGSL